MKELGELILEDIEGRLREKCTEIVLAAYAAEHEDVSPETKVRAHFIEVGSLSTVERISVQILALLGYIEPTGHAINSYRITSKASAFVKPFFDAKKSQRNLFENGR